MGRSIPEATIAIGRVRSMPFGRSRAEAAARQVRLIEAEGPDEVRAYALESLVEALTWAGLSEKAVVPFVKLLRWWDAHPEHFDIGDQNILFWEFGWIVNDLCRNPVVPVERVERTLDDMERRFNLANRGLERVWSCRLEWELMRRGDGLDKTFTTWLTLPLDEEDSCPACHQEHHADYLLEIGDIEGAVGILEAATTTDLSCSREPASMLALLAWCYLELGQMDEVEKILPHALAEIQSATSLSVLVAYARLFEVFGRGGDYTRAAGLMTKIHEGLTTATPYARLDASRHLRCGLKALLQQGYADQVIATVTVADYAAQVLDEVSRLTRQFDQRHGTTVQAARLARAESATLAPRLLSHEPAEVASETRDSPGVETVQLRVPPSAVLGEQAFQAGDHAEAARFYRVAASEAQTDGWLAQAGWYWAEAARNSQQTGSYDQAGHDYVQAHALLKAAGVNLEEIARMFVAWAPKVRQEDYGVFTRLALEDYPSPARPSNSERMEEILPSLIQASMVGSPLLRRYILARAELRDSVARVMATWGDTADLEAALQMAEESATRFSALGRTEAAAHAWWLAGRLAYRVGAPSADTDFTMAVQGFMSTGQRNRSLGWRVAGEYADFLRAAGKKEKADAILSSWKEKGD